MLAYHLATEALIYKQPYINGQLLLGKTCCLNITGFHRSSERNSALLSVNLIVNESQIIIMLN